MRPITRDQLTTLKVLRAILANLKTGAVITIRPDGVSKSHGWKFPWPAPTGYAQPAAAADQKEKRQ